jgi:hypothetical protein
MNDERYHRIPHCRGAWIRERCGRLEVYRCETCHTRHLLAPERIPALQFTVEDLISAVCA